MRAAREDVTVGPDVGAGAVAAGAGVTVSVGAGRDVGVGAGVTVSFGVGSDVAVAAGGAVVGDAVAGGVPDCVAQPDKPNTNTADRAADNRLMLTK
jgi:hypothetical protein